MKSDLDLLMQDKNLDALLVIGAAAHNPPMVYLTGSGHISNAVLIKKRGEQPLLFYHDMERDEAAKSGLKTISFDKYPWQELIQEAKGDWTLMQALQFQRMFNDLGLRTGRIGVYGHSDISAAYAALNHLKRLMPAIELVGESEADSVFMYAMETKDETEVERIRKMGKVTTEVVRRVAKFLVSLEVREDEILLKEDSSPLTVADIKTMINLWIAELGAENPEGTIFSIGREAGVPHSTGNPEDYIRLGQTIIFDIYPCEAGGGYFYDFTRTWCLGYALPEAQKLYDQVKKIYIQLLNDFKINTPYKAYQRTVCEQFEKQGHLSPLNTQNPLEGYVHSLGHGVGLNVHERPWSELQSTDDNLLKAGAVFACEPGLYYPERGMGVRIEDTLYIRPDGKVEILAEYPYDFVLKMKKWKK